MFTEWRQWVPGAKHGVARGSVVFWGPDGDADPDPDSLRELLRQCPRLRERAGEQGLELDDSPQSLIGLDLMSYTWGNEPRDTSHLDHDAGCYLGTVLVTNLPGARWHVWPNGHPVVRLASGRDVDVVAETTARRGELVAAYGKATNAS